MINNNYFKYLLKSNKYLSVFIFLIALLSAFVDKGKYLIIGISTLLCFVLPVNVFKFIHDKKAIDTYYSLPLSRKQLLNTSLLYIVLANFVPCAISFVVYNFVSSENIEVIKLLYILVLMILSIVTISCFNSLLYSLANNIFDGVAMIAAYSLLPIFILIVVTIFYEVFVCGSSGVNITFIEYISPTYCSILLYLKNIYQSPTFSYINEISHIISLVVFLVFSYIVLNKSFIGRKVERANTSSSNFFAYPLVIYLYTFLCLFGISSNYSYSYKTFGHFFEEFFVLYLITFAIFVIAHFIYRRKFFISIKMPIFFVIVLVLSLLFCNLARKTNGFSIANSYIKYEPDTKYQINSTLSSNEDIEWFTSKNGDSPDIIFVQIEAYGGSFSLDKKVVDIFEAYRKQAIDEFYTNNAFPYITSLNVYDDYYKEELMSNFTHRHYYGLREPLKINDILEIVKYDGVEVTISTTKADYLLEKNGDLLLVNLYNYDSEIFEAHVVEN